MSFKIWQFFLFFLFRRLKNKAAKTNNPIILKKIKMRSGDWFWELAETHTGLKRSKTASATVRASLRIPKKKGGKYGNYTKF